jgi:hypothetical protein
LPEKVLFSKFLIEKKLMRQDEGSCQKNEKTDMPFGCFIGMRSYD